MDAWVWQDEIGAEEGLPKNHLLYTRLAESIDLHDDGEILLIEYLVHLELPVLLGLVTIITITILAPKPGKKHVKAGNLYPCSSYKV